MRRKQVPAPIDPRRTATLTLPDGRVLEHPDEFTVKGQGRFKFHYGWQPSDQTHPPQATAYGPVASGDAKWRTFYANQITRIHRPKPTRTEPIETRVT